MSKFNTVALVTAGLVAAMTLMSVPAGAAGSSPEAAAAAASAAKAKAAHMAKARAKMEAAKRREMMAQMAMMKGASGMGLPVAIPAIGECKLDLKRWQATVSRMIKEDC